MAGVFQTGETKIRPGTYFNIQKTGDSPAAGAVNGIAAAVFRSDWGPLGTAVPIAAGEDYEAVYGTGENSDIIQHTLDGGAVTVICCRVGSGGTPQEVCLTVGEEAADTVCIRANYVGNRAFSISVRDKLSDTSKRECIIYTGTREFERYDFLKGGNEAAALINAFAGSKNFTAVLAEGAFGEFAEITQKAFTGGTNPKVTVEDYSDGFTAIEHETFHTVCVDTGDLAVHSLLARFLDRIYQSGQFAQGIAAENNNIDLTERMKHAAAFNSEKMVYLLNDEMETGNGVLKGYQTAARISGMIAACEANRSLTHTVLNGVTKLKERLTPSEMTKAETMGCLVLSVNPSGQIWIDNAINTLVTPADQQDEGWKKIRRTKTRYELLRRANTQAEGLIGKVDNDKNGRATIISQIQGIGDAMVTEGKLISCKVTESTEKPAEGDSAWFVIQCVDKDSAEHIYLTYNFQFSTKQA